MHDLGIVVADLRSQLLAYSKLPADEKAAFVFAPSNPSQEAWESHQRVTKPRMEQRLDDFVTEHLSSDLEEGIQRQLVTWAICPENGIRISRRTDVAATIGLRNYLALISDPDVVFSEQEIPHCPRCCTDTGDLVTHDPIHSVTRYCSRMVLDQWDSIDRASENVSFLERRIEESDDPRLEHLLDEHRRAVQDGYGRIFRIVGDSYPLATAAHRIKRDVRAKVVRAAIEGKSITDAVGIKLFVNTFSEDDLHRYMVKFHGQLSATPHLSIIREPQYVRGFEDNGFRFYKTVIEMESSAVFNIQVLTLQGAMQDAQSHFRYKTQRQAEYDALRAQYPIAKLEAALA